MRTLLLALVLGGLAAEPVRRPVSGAASVNWTEGRLEIVARAEPVSGSTDPRALEQAAIRDVAALVEGALDAVPVDPAQRLGSVPGLPVDRAARSWRVVETRYFASGPVEVVGGVPLSDVLAPWNTGRAETVPETPLPDKASGLVVDARGLDVTPVWSPRIEGPGGEVLYDGVLWSHLAWETAPVVWVDDPATAAAGIAGDTPVLALASEGGWGRVVLGPDDADAVRSTFVGTSAHRSGTVVIVVDP